MVKEAEGKAEAILRLAEAEAESIRRINEAKPDAAYVTLKGFEALQKLADGQSTKIVVPTEIANVTGLLGAIKNTLSEKK